MQSKICCWSTSLSNFSSNFQAKSCIFACFPPRSTTILLIPRVSAGKTCSEFRNPKIKKNSTQPLHISIHRPFTGRSTAKFASASPTCFFMHLISRPLVSVPKNLPIHSLSFIVNSTLEVKLTKVKVYSFFMQQLFNCTAH
jgi:hypothetical protein